MSEGGWKTVLEGNCGKISQKSHVASSKSLQKAEGLGLGGEEVAAQSLPL